MLIDDDGILGIMWGCAKYKKKILTETKWFKSPYVGDVSFNVRKQMSYRASLSMQNVWSVFSTNWWIDNVALYGSTTVSDTWVKGTHTKCLINSQWSTDESQCWNSAGSTLTRFWIPELIEVMSSHTNDFRLRCKECSCGSSKVIEIIAPCTRITPHRSLSLVCMDDEWGGILNY